MGQLLHGSARTTQATRRAIQNSQESIRALARRHGISPTTVQKWKKRSHVRDAPMGPKEARSSVLTAEEEAAVVAFRRHTLLPLDDCLYALQPSIPHLTRSSLHRCLQRHHPPRYRNGPTATWMGHLFTRLCSEHGIEHRLTKPNHPWTNGQVERMNRTIKEATVRRYHYGGHDQLRRHLRLFVAAYNHARRLKTLRGLTPYGFVCQQWTRDPERFKTSPLHHTPGLNT